MKVLVAVCVLSAMAVACSGAAGPPSEGPTIAVTATRPAVVVPAAATVEDRARYSARDVEVIIVNRGGVCRDARYAGSGIWSCGTWKFDEVTGQVFEGSSRGAR
jgi:hypothetical protein